MLGIILPKLTSFAGSVDFQNYVDFYMYLGDSYGNYAATVKISNISLDAQLILSFPDQQPFTNFSFASDLSSGEIPIRPINSYYTRVRVAWGNNAGLRLYDDSILPALFNNDTAYLGKKVSFVLYGNAFTNEYENPQAYHSFWDYMQIGLAMLVIFSATSLLFGLKRYIERRRMQREALLNGERLLVPVIRPIPQLHKYRLGIDSASPVFPISKEEFQSRVSPTDTLTATTLMILIPNHQESYLSQGSLPPFMFGTNIHVKSTKLNQKKGKSGSSSGEQTIEMIPLRIIKSSSPL